MSSQAVSKIQAGRNQRQLLELVSLPGNGQPHQVSRVTVAPGTEGYVDVCADCKTRHPRWASYNLGIFIWSVRLDPLHHWEELTILTMCNFQRQMRLYS